MPNTLWAESIKMLPWQDELDGRSASRALGVWGGGFELGSAGELEGAGDGSVGISAGGACGRISRSLLSCITSPGYRVGAILRRLLGLRPPSTRESPVAE